MAILVQSLVNRVADTLNDTFQERWTLVNLVGYLSDGQRAAVQIRPECNPKTATISLVAGTKQVIPSEAFRLLTCVRNISHAGKGPIIEMSRHNLDRYNKSWHAEINSSFVNGFIYDPRDRKTFYVYPAVAVDTTIEIMYSKQPDEINLVNNDVPADTNIELDDVYSPMLINYMLHRAYEKEIPVQGQSSEMVQLHYQRFMNYLVVRERSEQRVDPTHQIDLVKEKGPGY